MTDYKKTNEDGTLYNVASDNPIDNVITANTTLDASNSGQVILVGTDALTVTLPSASTAGLRYTFINSGADGAVALGHLFDRPCQLKRNGAAMAQRSDWFHQASLTINGCSIPSH